MIEENKTKLKTVSEKGISIVTVYDNYSPSEALAKEGLMDAHLETGWGFSCLIETKNQNILFDTGGDSQTLLSNIEKIKIDLKEIDIIVLSHIHGDHIGGLEGVLKINSNLRVFLLQSFPDDYKNTIKNYGVKIIEVGKPIEISEGIYSTGELGVWVKEQSLIINTEKGLVIITGCAHPEVINIIEKSKEIFPNKSVYLVLGGFHLNGISDIGLKNIINDFRKLGVQKVAPCHCSGDRARELFKEEYKDDFIENGVGRIIEI